MKNKRFKILMYVLIGILFLILCIGSIPVIQKLNDPIFKQQLYNFISSLGIWGIILSVLSQVLHIVIAIIPGEPFEILMGMLYGSVKGTIVCLIGILLGTIAVYYIMHKLGKNLRNRLMSDEKLNKYNFLKNHKKLDSIVFLLFFIPGTPKDLITYFVPLTNMKPIKFFIIATFARFPSVFSSVIAGDAIINQNWSAVIIIFVVTGIIATCGFIFYDKFILFFKKNKS